jgi:hypothetical protein
MIPFSSYPSMTAAAAAAQKRKIRLYIKSHRDFDTISFELMMTTFKPFLLNGIVDYSTITAGVLEMLSWEIDLYAKDFSLHIFIRRIFWERISDLGHGEESETEKCCKWTYMGCSFIDI